MDKFIEVLDEDGYAHLLNRDEIVQVTETSRRVAAVLMKGSSVWLYLRMSFVAFRDLLEEQENKNRKEK